MEENFKEEDLDIPQFIKDYKKKQPCDFLGVGTVTKIERAESNWEKQERLRKEKE